MNLMSKVLVFVVLFIGTVWGSAYSYVKRTDGQSYSYEVDGHSSHSSHGPSYQQSQSNHQQNQRIHHQQSHNQQKPSTQYQQPPQFGKKIQSHLNQQVLPTSDSQVISPQSTQQHQNSQPDYDTGSSSFHSESQGNVQGNVNYPQVQTQQNYGQTQSTQTNFGHGFESKGFAYPKYKFEYGVKDPRTGDHKSQWEIRDGDVVKGEYTLDEADGTKRIVEYKADSKHGFNAIVKKIGHAHHPEIQVFGNPF